MRYWLLSLALVLGISGAAIGASEPISLAEVVLDHSPAAIKRGAMVYTDMCMFCHSLKYVKYRDLAELGFTAAELDRLRQDLDINAPLVTTTPAENARAMFGMVPPDLSLMAKARKGGSRYIYTLLTSYYQDAMGGTNNRLFPGTKMPDVFGVSFVDQPADLQTLQENAQDVATFLTWAADPKADKRYTMGYYVMIYLVLLTILLYLLKRRVWSRLTRQ